MTHTERYILPSLKWISLLVILLVIVLAASIYMAYEARLDAIDQQIIRESSGIGKQ